jgi:hypothetical protein
MIPFMRPEFIAWILSRRCSDTKYIEMPIDTELDDYLEKPNSLPNERLTVAEVLTLVMASLGSALDFTTSVVFVFLANLIGRLFAVAQECQPSVASEPVPYEQCS